MMIAIDINENHSREIEWTFILVRRVQKTSPQWIRFLVVNAFIEMLEYIIDVLFDFIILYFICKSINSENGKEHSEQTNRVNEQNHLIICMRDLQSRSMLYLGLVGVCNQCLTCPSVRIANGTILAVRRSHGTIQIGHKLFQNSEILCYANWNKWPVLCTFVKKKSRIKDWSSY